MAMAPCAPVGARWLCSLVVTLAFLTTCHAAFSRAGAGAARKLAQTNTCSTSDVRRYFAGERNRNSNPCGRCGSGRVAWCCRSDERASPDSCKPAGASCCSGPEFRYSYYDRDGDLEQDDLDDVWCMPASCTTNFRPPGSNAATTARAQNNNQQCETRNDDRDHVGEYKRSQDPQRIAQNKQVCGRCAARNQRAWCCRSDDFASTDPLNCKPAKTGANCCDGNEYLYTDDDGDMDRMDDVWCLPATCRAT